MFSVLRTTTKTLTKSKGRIQKIPLKPNTLRSTFYANFQVPLLVQVIFNFPVHLIWKLLSDLSKEVKNKL